MTQHLLDRINRKLAGLSDDRLYQILDFVEFIELKYPASQPPAAAANPLQRFADGLEDRLRAGGVAASTVAEAMGFLNKAVGVLGNVATAAQSAAQTAAQRVGDVVQEVAQEVSPSAPPGGPRPAGTGSATGEGGTPPAAPPPPAGGAAHPPPGARPQ